MYLTIFSLLLEYYLLSPILYLHLYQSTPFKIQVFKAAKADIQSESAMVL